MKYNNIGTEQTSYSQYLHSSINDVNVDTLNQSFSTTWVSSDYVQSNMKTQAIEQNYSFKGQSFDNPYYNYDQWKELKSVDEQIQSLETQLETKLAILNDKPDFFRGLQNQELIVEEKPEIKNDLKEDNKKATEMTAAQMLVSTLINAGKATGVGLNNIGIGSGGLATKQYEMIRATKEAKKERDIGSLCNEAKAQIDKIVDSKSLLTVKPACDTLNDQLKNINLKMRYDLARAEDLQGKPLDDHLKMVSNNKSKVDSLIEHGRSVQDIISKKSTISGSKLDIKASMDSLKESMRKMMENVKKIVAAFVPNNRRATVQ